MSNKFQTETIAKILRTLKDMGKDVLGSVNYTPTLARGLDYYTGMIFETVCEGSTGSLCSGGRWDKMIGAFTGTEMPAVGFGLGFDRTIEVLDQKGLFPDFVTSTKVLVTIFSKELELKSLEAVSSLRKNGINAEITLGNDIKMEKQLKYADQKGIDYVVIIGPKEAEIASATVKNMKTTDQETVKIENLQDAIR